MESTSTDIEWQLCEDSIVLDLMKILPRVAIEAIQSAHRRPIQAGWQSTSHSWAPSQQHYNHSCPEGEGYGPIIPGRFARDGSPARAFGPGLNRSEYRDWKTAWEATRELLGAPEGCFLLRMYNNVYPYGADACAHTDSGAPDEVTVCLSVHPHWEADWGGETVTLDPNGEVHRAVIPRPGRLFAFRSAVSHAARPVARAAATNRSMLVMKMGPWPVEHPLATAATDSILSPAPHPPETTGRPIWDGATDQGRIAMATQWVLASKAVRLPHGRTNLAAHLVATAMWLRSWDLDTTTILGGLAHALCGTQHYRTQCFDPIRDRAELETVFTKEGMDLAFAFASCDRKQLSQLHANSPKRSTHITLKRDARGPEGDDAYGPLKVSLDTLAALLYIDAANQLTLGPLEACRAFDDARKEAAERPPRNHATVSKRSGSK